MKKIPFLFFALLIALSSSPLFAQSYAKGDSVEGFWHGAWYKANIREIMREGYYKVHFNGYWASREEVLPADRLRPLPTRTQPDLNTLKSGGAIEFLEGDHWRPATFVELQGRKALIRYADGQSQKEGLVPIGHLSAVPAPASPVK